MKPGSDFTVQNHGQQAESGRDQVLVSIRDAVVVFGGRVVFSGLNLGIRRNQHLAVVGETGSGKSALLKALAGQYRVTQGRIEHYCSNLCSAVYVDIRHDFRPAAGVGGFFYQQRFNAGYADEAPTVEEYLVSRANNADTDCPWTLESLYKIFGLESIRHRHLIKLSSGEGKRLRLAAAVLKNPGLLLLDCPLAGLDEKNRKIFEDIFVRIADSGTCLVMATDPGQIPDVVTHVAVLDENRNLRLCAGKDYKPLPRENTSRVHADARQLGRLMNSGPGESFEILVSMQNVKVSYGNDVIFENICWQIRQGERWALSGPNGSGKSTLLSLIYGDHPQAYANDIVLFDRRRGSGESIWDIKRKIGFMSPELFQYFPARFKCLQAVESGFYDTMGMVLQSRKQYREKAAEWMEIMGLAELKDRFFYEIPAGQQRMCLLARALVKNPYLLLLDEPCQGLDPAQQNAFRQLIDTIAQISSLSLVYVTHQAEELPACIDHSLQLE